MIADFLSIKEKFHREINILLREEVKKRMPFLSRIGSRTLHEGDKHSYGTVEQEKRNMEFKTAESSFSFTREEMSEITLPQIIQKMQGVAEDMAGQIEKGAFSTLIDDLEKHDRSVPGNPPFSQAALLQGLEMIDIDFEDDQREKPKMPTLVMHPDVLAKAKEQDEKMTPEERAALVEKRDKVFDKKYAEYMEREGKRKMID